MYLTFTLSDIYSGSILF